MDTAKIKEIISIFEGSALTGMELEVDDLKLKLNKEMPIESQSRIQQISRPSQEKDIPLSKQEEVVNGEVVRSPLVGTFYAAAGEQAKPFVEIGTKVEKGDILCIIEAMKVMNEIHAPTSGVVKEIYIKDGDMVQFDEELMVIGE